MKKYYFFAKMLRKDKPDAFSAVLLGICLCFYLFFAFYDGAVICVDSPGYISMRLSREPFYPLFLAFFRKLFSSFPNDFYLTAVAFFQSGLMAFATWALVRYLWKELRLPKGDVYKRQV